jgi:hypothetical protein
LLAWALPPSTAGSRVTPSTPSALCRGRLCSLTGALPPYRWIRCVAVWLLDGDRWRGQFSDQTASMFFQRITFDFSDIVIGPGNTSVLERAIAELASRYSMKWQVGTIGCTDLRHGAGRHPGMNRPRRQPPPLRAGQQREWRASQAWGRGRDELCPDAGCACTAAAKLTPPRVTPSLPPRYPLVCCSSAGPGNAPDGAQPNTTPPHGLRLQIAYKDKIKRLAILVSKQVGWGWLEVGRD